MTGALYALQFDLMTDLEPIIQIASEPMMIVGKKDFPANDLKEMIAWLKANPDKASVGIPGVGGTGHLTGLAFQKETGTRFHVRAVSRQRARRCRTSSPARSICRSSRRRTFTRR